MILNKETHARKNLAGGGYKNRNNPTKGGCYRIEVVSSMERKEVGTI